GKFPAFGWVDLKLALRNLSTRRFRTATTLLAISAGMFALSSIVFIGESARSILNFTLTESLGGNVVIFPLIPGGLGQNLVDNRLNTLQGVEYRSRLNTLTGSITTVDGRTVYEPMSEAEENRIYDEIQIASESGDFERMNELFAQLPQQQYVTISSRDTDNPNPSTDGLVEGRVLTPEDRGEFVAVVRLTEDIRALDVRLGSMITVQAQNFGGFGSNNSDDDPAFFTFEVVGVLAEGNASLLGPGIGEGAVQVPPETLFTGAFANGLTLAQVQPEYLNEVLVSLSALPLVFAFDVTFFDSVLTRLIDQFSALPILVGILSLAAAAVIMANTVALATLERRRQIGILKAIGLKGGRVLGIMLLENVLVSLLGGVIGIGLSVIGVYLITTFGLESAILIPTNALPTAVALVLTAVAIGTLATVLSASAAIQERVLNVLRYE
ncbi:MAG: ABC transporter permease, partial [Armatimonadetes bacterium]|nr:ABC transporter permease [Anaerolineae bacterium]